MQHKWLTNEGNTRLILIFLGWGSDGNLLGELSKPGYDILAVWDYRVEDFDFSPLGSYSEICLVAWSLGVMEAARLLHAANLPITLRLAVNGTVYPVDAEKGIAPHLFEGTITNMSPRNLIKFFKRMCKESAQFAQLQEGLPDRTLPELVDELTTLGQRAQNELIPDLRWTKAIVGEADAIFLPANQLRAWEGTPLAVLPIGHLPMWGDLIDREIVDKEFVAQRFGATRDSYEDNAKSQAQAAQFLWDATMPFLPSSGGLRVLEVGSGSGTLSRMLASSGLVERLDLWDIAEGFPLPKEVEAHFSCCDAETAIGDVSDNTYDLIISASTIQWLNNPADFINRCARKLRPGGVVAVATYGPETCRELRDAGAPVRHYPDSHYYVDRLDESLRLLYSHTREVVLEFDTPSIALHHLRQTGVNALSRTCIAPGSMRQILRNYPINSRDKAPLTFQQIFIIAQTQKQ